MPSSRPRQRFIDIVKNCQRISGYVGGLTYDQFERDEKTFDAVVLCLLGITEAAAKLGSLAETHAPHQNWPRLRALGNIIRHQYDDVLPDVIWDIVTTRLSSLAQDCEAALLGLPDDP